MSKSSEDFFTAIDGLTGSRACMYEITDPKEIRPVYVATYDHVPEVSQLTAFTFGLSSANHREWVFGKPELMISVKSMDHAWGLCMGEIVKNNRDALLFELGTILHFRERITDASPLTSFLVFTNSLLGEAEEALLLSARKIRFAQLYPIYESEAELVRDIGVERFFWELGIDFSDVSRPSAQFV